MTKGRTRRRWAALVPVAATLALLGGCVMAPLEPWDIGEPAVTSGSIYYGNAYRPYPDYYYYSTPPRYYGAPPRPYRRPGNAHHGRRYRPDAPQHGYSGRRPDRNQPHERPGSRPSTGHNAGRPSRAVPRPPGGGPSLSGRHPNDTANHGPARNDMGRANRGPNLGGGGAMRGNSGFGGVRGGH